MGITRSFINKSHRSFKGEAQQEDKLIRQTINSLRDDCKQFYGEVYNKMFKYEDDRVLLEMMKTIEKDDIGDKEKMERKKKVKKVAKSNRIILEFKKDPFNADTPLVEIFEIHSVGAISDQEFKELLRSRLNLDPRKNVNISIKSIDTNEVPRKDKPVEKVE